MIYKSIKIRKRVIEMEREIKSLCSCLNNFIDKKVSVYLNHENPIHEVSFYYGTLVEAGVDYLLLSRNEYGIVIIPFSAIHNILIEKKYNPEEK